MGCSNHPTPKDIAEIQSKSKQMQEKVKDAVARPAPGKLKQAANEAAKEVAKFASKQIEQLKQSDKPVTREEVAAVKQRIERFAKEKQTDISRQSTNEVVMTERGRALRDSVPPHNPNPDRGTIPGFHMGVHEEPGHINIIMRDDNEPNRSTHVHHHKDGITLSSFRYVGVDQRTGRKIAVVDRFTFGKASDWPAD